MKNAVAIMKMFYQWVLLEFDAPPIDFKAFASTFGLIASIATMMWCIVVALSG